MLRDDKVEVAVGLGANMGRTVDSSVGMQCTLAYGF